MAKVETIKGILYINGAPHVCQNEEKDIWVPIKQEVPVATNKKEPGQPEKKPSAHKGPKGPGQF